LTDPCCHGNEIRDKMGYISACTKDISNIFESLGERAIIEWGQSNSTTTDLAAMATTFVEFGKKLMEVVDVVKIVTSAKEVMFLPVFVCLSVCLCVSKITQNVMDRSFWNFERMSGMA